MRYTQSDGYPRQVFHDVGCTVAPGACGGAGTCARPTVGHGSKKTGLNCPFSSGYDQPPSRLSTLWDVVFARANTLVPAFTRI